MLKTSSINYFLFSSLASFLKNSLEKLWTISKSVWGFKLDERRRKRWRRKKRMREKRWRGCWWWKNFLPLLPTTFVPVHFEALSFNDHFSKSMKREGKNGFGILENFSRLSSFSFPSSSSSLLLFFSLSLSLCFPSFSVLHPHHFLRNSFQDFVFLSLQTENELHLKDFSFSSHKKTSSH